MKVIIHYKEGKAMSMKLSALVMAACLVLPLSAQAAEYGVYVTPKIGGAIEQFKVTGANHPDPIKGTDGSFGGGLAVGYDFHTKWTVPVRVELEYTAWTGAEENKSENYSQLENNIVHNYSSTGKAKVGVQSLFANIYADWHNSTAFTPYVSAGVGVGFVSTKADLRWQDTTGTGYTDQSHLGSKTKTNFAWNVGLGCSYAFNDTISADLGYRFASFGSGKTGAEPDGFAVKSKNNYMHQLLLGVRFTF